jgi:hypothetical protein
VVDQSAPVEFKKNSGNQEFVYIDDNNNGKVKTVAQYIVENILGEKQKIENIEGKRRVFPTPNNPISSRSHVIIHIIVKDADGNIIANLFVGDFAGVENEFILDFKTACTFQHLYKKEIGEKLDANELADVAAEQEGLEKYNSEKYVDVIQEYKNNKDLFDKLREVGIAKIDAVIDALAFNEVGNIAGKAAVARITAKGPAADEDFERERKRMAEKQNGSLKPVAKAPPPKPVAKPSPPKPVATDDKEPPKRPPRPTRMASDAAANRGIIEARANAEKKLKELEKSREDNRQKTIEKAKKDGVELRNTVKMKRGSLTGNPNTGGNKTKKKLWRGGDILEEKTTEYVGNIRDILNLGGKRNQEILDIKTIVKNISTNDVEKAKEALQNILIQIKTYKENLNKACTRIAKRLNIEMTQKINYDKVIELADELDKYVPYLDSFEIIRQRNTEGEYINDSLSELRADIKHILDQRNSKCIYYAPAIDPNCIDQYCPTLNNCFSTSTEAKESVGSDIMEWVIGKYDETKKEVSTNFQDSCVLSVFCVFNVTLGVNDPPVMPYINTDKFEQILQKMQNQKTIESDADGTVTVNEQDKEIPSTSFRLFKTLTDNINQKWQSVTEFPFTKRPEKINYNNCLERINAFDEYLEIEQKYTDRFQTILSGFTSIQPFALQTETEKAKITNITTNLIKLQKEMDTAVATKGKQMLTKVIPKKEELNELKTEFNAISESIKKQIDKKLTDRVALNNVAVCREFLELTATMNSMDGKFTASDINADVVWNIQTNAKAFLEVMHKYNASTDIGTVKYLDNFAKSDTTKFMCIETNEIDKDDKYTVPYSNFMKEVHEKQPK